MNELSLEFLINGIFKHVGGEGCSSREGKNGKEITFLKQTNKYSELSLKSNHEP